MHCNMRSCVIYHHKQGNSTRNKMTVIICCYQEMNIPSYSLRKRLSSYVKDVYPDEVLTDNLLPQQIKCITQSVLMCPRFYRYAWLVVMVLHEQRAAWVNRYFQGRYPQKKLTLDQCVQVYRVELPSSFFTSLFPEFHAKVLPLLDVVLYKPVKLCCFNSPGTSCISLCYIVLLGWLMLKALKLKAFEVAN